MTTDERRQQLAASLRSLHQQHATLARHVIADVLASTSQATTARSAIEQAAIEMQQVIDSAQALECLTRDIVAAVRSQHGATDGDVERTAAQVKALVAQNVAAMAGTQSAAFALQMLATSAIMLVGAFKVDEYCARPAVLRVAS